MKKVILVFVALALGISSQATAGVTSAVSFSQDGSYSTLAQATPSSFVRNITATQASYNTVNDSSRVGTFDAVYTTALTGNSSQPETSVFNIALTNDTDEAILFANIVLKDIQDSVAAFSGTASATSFTLDSSSSTTAFFTGSLAPGATETFTVNIDIDDQFNKNFTLEFTSGIPEPSTFAMFGIAGIAFAGFARRRLSS